MGSQTDRPEFYSRGQKPPPETWPDPRLALTISDFARRQWKLRARCDRCDTFLWCDTGDMIKMVGPDAFMWGRQGKCRVMIGISRCHGRTRFEAKTARSDAWYSLDGDMVRRARHLLRVRAMKAESAPAP